MIEYIVGAIVAIVAIGALLLLTSGRSTDALDAKRYRWLREQNRVTADQSPLKAAYRFTRWVSAEEVDSLIDAALAVQQQAEEPRS